MENNYIESNPSEIIKDIYKLKVKFRVLENNLESYLGNGRNISYEILNKSLLEIHNYNASRESDCNKLRNCIDDIKAKTNKFKLSIKNIQLNDGFVRSTKEMMEDIEILITELKRDQKDNYGNLLRSEILLWQECVFMEKKILAWASGDHERDLTYEKPSFSALNNLQEVEENTSVLALQKFLDETGGKTGGWSAIDHQTFLRIRMKYTRININEGVNYPRDEDTFINDLLSLLAPKSKDDVKHHEMWYRKYQELLFQKKKAISDWKQQKSNLSNNAEILTEEISSPAKSDWELQKKRLENQRRAIDSWRAEKALEEHRLKMEKENALKEEIEKRNKEREKERSEIRELLNEYKNRKQIEEGEKMEKELKVIELDKEERKKDREIHSARINERSTRMMEQKLLRQHQKQIEVEQKQQRLKDLRNQVSITAKKDPSRLLRPTSVWLSRLANSTQFAGSSHEVNSTNIRISDVQHKAVPNWRRDMI